jgi:MYXO-CTERM domain-containing protein
MKLRFAQIRFSSSLLSASVLGATLLGAHAAHAMTGADTCAAATLSADSLAAPLVINDTTVGQTDDINIDTNTAAPACTETPPACVGGGPPATLPGGEAFASSGLGPDRVFRFQVDSACTLDVSMAPAAGSDMMVMLSTDTCGNTAAECSCVDDSAAAGVAEGLTGITATPGTDYFIIVDGWNNAANTFTLTITRTAGTCSFVVPAATDAGAGTDSGTTTPGSDASTSSPDSGGGPIVVTPDASTSSPDSGSAGGAPTAAGGSGNPNTNVDGSAPSGGGGPNFGGGNPTGNADASTDGGVTASAGSTKSDSSCGCAMVGAESSPGAAWLAVLGMFSALGARRRKSAR